MPVPHDHVWTAAILLISFGSGRLLATAVYVPRVSNLTLVMYGNAEPQYVAGVEKLKQGIGASHRQMGPCLGPQGLLLDTLANFMLLTGLTTADRVKLRSIILG